MSAGKVIYLDNHSTTRCDPRVVQAMLPCLEQDYANPSSVTHAAGQRAGEIVGQCSDEIARLIGAERGSEIVFTSGATESNHLAIVGFCRRKKVGHLITVATEHPSVLAAMDVLLREGWTLTTLPVRPAGDSECGRIDLQMLRDAIRPGTALVSVMLANHEIGVIQPVREIAAICREQGVALHCDATQAVGKFPLSVRELDVDLMSFTAHKFYGPKGIGALFVRGSGRRARLEPVMSGGGQQQGRRGGTLNVPGIVGLAMALQLSAELMPEETGRIAGLRDQLFQSLASEIPGMVLNGAGLESGWRLPHNLNLQLPGVDGHSLMVHCPELALSSGSACTATSTEPSHVLQALGMNADEIRCSLRFGLGRFNSAEEIRLASRGLVRSYRRLRGLH